MTDEFFRVTPDVASRLAVHGPLPSELERAAEMLAADTHTTPTDTRTADGAFALVVTPARDLCAEPDSDSGQLLGPLILAGGRTIIVGDTGQGKTSLAFQMIRATLDQRPFLDWTGAGAHGRALIVDLEQGRRSVKRGLRDAELDTRTDVDLVLVPDGLSLDRDPEHLAELDRVITNGGYTIVDLDPYYKAHRADEPNAERPIVDLMRTLDSLRARHGFALILPAHPRKDQVGAPAVRKLTIHDIAGSGAVTRGAEVVLGIERVAHGHARLRYLKDREGDLPIGEAWNLLFSKLTGFTRNPKDHAAPRDYRAEILAESTNGEWRTVSDYMTALEAGDKALRPALNELVEKHQFEYQVGPTGRAKNAKCWRPTASFLVEMGHNIENTQNCTLNGSFAAQNEADEAMEQSGQFSLSNTPNEADEADQNPPEDLTASSGVFPVRGSTQDGEAGTSTLLPDSPPELTDADIEALDVDLEQPLGHLDETEAA